MYNVRLELYRIKCCANDKYPHDKYFYQLIFNKPYLRHIYVMDGVVRLQREPDVQRCQEGQLSMPLMSKCYPVPSGILLIQIYCLQAGANDKSFNTKSANTTKNQK